MALRRSFHSNFDPIVAERVNEFSGLWLPRCLEDEDIDQEFPLEVNDGYIIGTEIFPIPGGQIYCALSAPNSHWAECRTLPCHLIPNVLFAVKAD